MHRKTRVDIYPERIKRNLKAIKKSSGAKSLCVMVKANAYGHGLVQTVKALGEDVDSLGIISLEEAEELRASGVKTPLWLFSNLWCDSTELLRKWGVIPVIGDFESLGFLLSSGLEIDFHIKLNTGMNRFGFKANQIQELNQLFVKYQRFPIAAATHMLDGNSFPEDESQSSVQLYEFEKLLDSLEAKIDFYHIYKSAPALLNSGRTVNSKYMDWVRPGIAAYGVYPDQEFSRETKIEPAMELKTVIISFQEIEAGETVSYSGTWTAERPTLIGVCQIGYADGLLRNLSNKIEMLVAGKRVPQVGNICMDYCMLDLTKVRGLVNIGDEVVVFGRQGDKVIEVEELANLGKTIAYEILTSIAPRVKRHYIIDETEAR